MAQTTAEKRTGDAAISREECRAMRALDGDDEYTRSEIAFLFECKVPTVTRHAECQCNHSLPAADRSRGAPVKYPDSEMLSAFREVYDRVSYERMSQSAYDSARDDDHPSASAIIRRFGSWTVAREEAWRADNER